ncbi:MAG TPA: 50S ribosomal protein L19 [Candidatus Sumerlaeota bacterium]|nr:50S ribosomal protein L19 [Candidatus Sumerlaeota bacterium]HPS02800.1 50S ribosomal protein L19 [Candidatus Sumerlaeota bacterium]
MHNLVREFEAARVSEDKKVNFRPGDTVRVHVRIIEGGKERIQDYEGVCIRRHGGGLSETFTVRRISYGVGMERIFPMQSPRIAGIDVVRHGKVRRANLTYLRSLRGKKARIVEDLLRTRKNAKVAAEAAVNAKAALNAKAAAADAAAAQPAE